MSDAKYGLRTITRSLISRQVIVSGSPALLPIPEIVGATQLVIDPGIELLELPGVNCKGEQTIELTVPAKRLPTMAIEYSVGAPEMDALIHGRILEAKTGFAGFVFFESVAESTSIAARTSGQAGYEVVAQDSTSTAEIYYIDPETHLAQKVSVVASSPTGDQVAIGEHMAITLSSALAASGVILRGWIPCTFGNATAITTEDLGVMSIKAMGVDFNGKMAGFIARNCTFLPGGTMGSNPQKSVKMRILPDSNDGTGLGFQFYYTNQTLVC